MHSFKTISILFLLLTISTSAHAAQWLCNQLDPSDCGCFEGPDHDLTQVDNKFCISTAAAGSFQDKPNKSVGKGGFKKVVKKSKKKVTE